MKELSKADILNELDRAFELYEKIQKDRANVIIELTSPSDDFVNELAFRFEQKRAIRKIAHDQIRALISKA